MTDLKGTYCFFFFLKNRTEFSVLVMHFFQWSLEVKSLWCMNLFFRVFLATDQRLCWFCQKRLYIYCFCLTMMIRLESDIFSLVNLVHPKLFKQIELNLCSTDWLICKCFLHHPLKIWFSWKDSLCFLSFSVL